MEVQLALVRMSPVQQVEQVEQEQLAPSQEHLLSMAQEAVEVARPQEVLLVELVLAQVQQLEQVDWQQPTQAQAVVEQMEQLLAITVALVAQAMSL